MMLELLKGMILEEIRLHSELRGRKSLFLFPITLVIITSLITYFMSLHSSISQSSNLVITFLMIFFAFGIISGTFGLHASDYLERRFGDFGRLFSNSLILPIKLSNVFLMAAISDSVFYFGWFIFPIIFGFALGIFFLGGTLITIPLLLFAISLAFITGICISFFLTVLITKSKVYFYLILILLSLFSTYGMVKFGLFFFLPYYLYVQFGLVSLTYNLLLIMFLLFFTVKLIGNEYNTINIKKKHKSFIFSSRFAFLFKDFIDLYRTHGLIAKPLFNVVIPSILMLLLLSSINLFQDDWFAITKNLIFIAILLGTLSINFFNILLSSDSFDYYIFLPASLKDFIIPKIILSLIICSFQGIILLGVYAYFNSNFANIFSSILVLVSFIFYTMCINLFINGLKPNYNSLNIHSLAWMSVLFLPLILIGMILPLFFDSTLYFFIYSLIVVMLGLFFYKKGIKKLNLSLGF